MSSTREFRKNPTHALKMYSQFFLPMKNFIDGQIKKLNLEVDVDQLYPVNDVWAYFCNDSISQINRRKNRMKRKDAADGHLKRPKTAFMWFITEKRVDFVKKNPEAGITTVTKELSKVWGQLSEKEKAVYMKMYDDDKVRYEKERKEVLDKVKEDDQDLIDSKPKKPLNSYLYFMKDESIKDKLKQEHQKLIATGVNKTHLQFISSKWESLTEQEKTPYEKKAEEDTKRFQKEMEEYNKKVKESESKEKTA
jgi:high mobility group protein B1